MIRAVESGDTAALGSLVAFVQLPCGPQQGPGSPPACRSQPAGTLVDVFPVSSCEGELRPASALAATLAGFAAAHLRLHGAYSVRLDQFPPLAGVYLDGREQGLPRAADHMVVFAGTEPSGPVRALAVVLAGGRVVGFKTGCFVPAETLVPAGAQPLPAS